jgi:glycine cleavage system H protein
MNIPQDLFYTSDHEWIKAEGDFAIVGITDFAQSELGDIVYIDIQTLGQKVEGGSVFGSVEAVKTVSDLFLPVTATITELNPDLESNPDFVNSDPYGKGWLVKIKPETALDSANLLSADAYKTLIGV